MGIKKKLRKRLSNTRAREKFVRSELSKLPNGAKLLDAGCGSQQYRKFAAHLNYFSQDIGTYSEDEKEILGSQQGGLGGVDGYQYGDLDYVGNIWEIDEAGSTFDAVLCTEVFEHIPYPIETVREFSRLLRPGGRLILTAPSNCLRHMDPYFYYTGFSDRWYEKILPESGLAIETIQTNGDYYSWLSVEMARTMLSHSVVAKICLFPAFVYYFFKRENQKSIDTLTMGYHIVAKRL